MKKKLNVVFILIAVALSGIIFFQIYWTVNAYNVNKEKFDTNINVAMQNAMDDCKKDYFDSIRRVLVKHLSPPETIIRVDTIQNRLAILFLTQKSFPGEPYITSESALNFYRTKINHRATLPEIMAEMSFYEPKLIRQIMDAYDPFMGHSFNSNDMLRHPNFFKTWVFKGQPIFKNYIHVDKLTNNLPPFYQHLRDSAIIAYFADNKKTGTPLLPSPAISLNATFTPKPIIHKDTTNIISQNSKYEAGFRAGQLASKVAHAQTDNKSTKVDSTAIKNMHIQLSLHLTPPQSNTNNTIPNHHAQYLAGLKAFETQMQSSIFGTPPNYRLADSLKLSRYLENELSKKHIYAKFKLTINTKTTSPAKPNANFSETDEVEYKYFGFKVFGNGPNSLFIRAEFHSPFYNVLRNMLFILLLSLILIVFVIFCFNYIVRTFIEQKKLADLKDDFINNMTHELKTPIATITVAIEGLQQFNALNDPEKTQRYLQTSRNELTRLNDLVTKVLDIATFENKEIDLFKQPVDINELIAEVIISEKSKVEKVVDIAFHNADNLSIISVDKIHFKNVLINLIDNAIKYSVEPVIITIACYKHAGNAVISIKDNGIGIPAGHINHIFDKFHRVPTGNLHLVKGTGLGLSYVKYIVEAHGGSISVKSEVNKGSEFIVSIPLNNG